MVSKLIEFVKKHEFLVIFSLGLTLNFSVSFSGNSQIDFELNIKTLVSVLLGYQILKHVTKVITNKRTK